MGTSQGISHPDETMRFLWGTPSSSSTTHFTLSCWLPYSITVVRGMFPAIVTLYRSLISFARARSMSSSTKIQSGPVAHIPSTFLMAPVETHHLHQRIEVLLGIGKPFSTPARIPANGTRRASS